MPLDWVEELKQAEACAKGKRIEAEIYRMALGASSEAVEIS